MGYGSNGVPGVHIKVLNEVRRKLRPYLMAITDLWSMLRLMSKSQARHISIVLNKARVWSFLIYNTQRILGGSQVANLIKPLRS